MRRFSLTFFVLLTSLLTAGSVSSQESETDQHSAPVQWVDYSVPALKVSIGLPKLPVAREEANPCSEIESKIYYAYARGAIYEFEVHYRNKKTFAKWCTTTIDFSEAAFTARVTELKGQSWNYVEKEEKINGRSLKVLRSTSTAGSIVKTRWLLWQEDRWYELGVTHREDVVVDEASFLRGLNVTSATGISIDIGRGADSTLGDSDIDAKSDSAGKVQTGLVIVTKPRPGYTDEARLSNIQGAVILRVTFLRNGGIGSISVVKDLSMGLTERAVIAAKKIAFLPATVDGKPINVTKQIEYTFSIY